MVRRAKVIRFPKTPPEPRDDRGLVEVHRCRNQAEALVLKGLFESEGLPCVLRTRLVHSIHPFTIGDQGEVIVLVPEAEVTRARILLARGSAGPSFP
ncbi:MAG: putative signal transducing protein [Candidatus Methylomirabilia bacterium]